MAPPARSRSAIRSTATKSCAPEATPSPSLSLWISTNLAVGPTSRVVLDRFVYEGDANSEKVAVGFAKGVFRFTTGTLDKKAYTITTPTAAIGVRGTVLDINVKSADTRVTLVEGRALVCPRRSGVSLEEQARNCGSAFGGGGGHTGKCDCAELDHPGQTASAKRSGGTTTASLTDNAVNFASLCGGDSSLCSKQFRRRRGRRPMRSLASARTDLRRGPARSRSSPVSRLLRRRAPERAAIPPSPLFPLTNIFAGGGSCSVDTSAGAVTVQAQLQPPNVFGFPIFPGFGYTGFAVSAYSGGADLCDGRQPAEHSVLC